MSASRMVAALGVTKKQQFLDRVEILFYICSIRARGDRPLFASAVSPATDRLERPGSWPRDGRPKPVVDLLPLWPGANEASARKLNSFVWTDRNTLKSLESDEGIQDNPSPFSWSGLALLWFGLEEFGLRRSADGVGRSRPARPEWTSLSLARPEMSPQRLEKIESALRNGMASESFDPQHLGPAIAAKTAWAPPSTFELDRRRALRPDSRNEA